MVDLGLACRTLKYRFFALRDKPLTHGKAAVPFSLKTFLFSASIVDLKGIRIL